LQSLEHDVIWWLLAALGGGVVVVAALLAFLARLDRGLD
jgi:hypothetical protein